MAEAKSGSGGFDAMAAKPKHSGVPKPSKEQLELMKWGAKSLPTYQTSKGRAAANDPLPADRQYWSRGFLLQPPDELRCHPAGMPVSPLLKEVLFLAPESTHPWLMKHMNCYHCQKPFSDGHIRSTGWAHSSNKGSHSVAPSLLLPLARPLSPHHAMYSPS